MMDSRKQSRKLNFRQVTLAHYYYYYYLWGYAVTQLAEAVRYKEGSGFDSPMVSLEFFIDIILSTALWPWG